MGITKDELLGRLQELQINFIQYEHPSVLTVEAQAKCLDGKEGSLTKNLFLKDKKNRFYIISALSTTKVDMKILSQRLGLGKGGIRMAPEEALNEILQVPLGCVTPFAVVNDTARDVALVLDKGFKTQKACFFHPLCNKATLSLSHNELDKFLQSINKPSTYVDLEDEPPIGKDQPPDLAFLVPMASIVEPSKSVETLEPSKSVETLEPSKSVETLEPSKPIKVLEPFKPKPTSSKIQQEPFESKKRTLVEELLDKISSLHFKEISAVQTSDQLGPVISDYIRKHAGSDLSRMEVMVKNAAYTSGFHAGKNIQSKSDY